MTDWQSSKFADIQIIRRPGTGVPIVLLPGVMADATTWHPVADAISLQNPIVIVNRRGRAPSRDLGSDYNLLTEVNDLNSVVSWVGEPFHLFGWSYGALIAIEAVSRGLPARSLIAYEPVSRPFAPETIAPIRSALEKGDLDRAVEIVNVDVSGFDPAHVSTLRSTPAWSTLCRLAVPLADELEAIDRFDANFVSYGEIDIPVTLILGALNENILPYGQAFARFAAAMPAAHVDRMNGQGHLAHVDAPDVLARHIERAIIEAEGSLH